MVTFKLLNVKPLNYLFILLMSFTNQTILILIKSNLSFFSVKGHIFGDVSKNSLLT